MLAAPRRVSRADAVRRSQHFIYVVIKRQLCGATVQTDSGMAFPVYAVPDLVGYSVYELVQQKMVWKKVAITCAASLTSADKPPTSTPAAL